jgi:hypothetical protein
MTNDKKENIASIKHLDDSQIEIQLNLNENFRENKTHLNQILTEMSIFNFQIKMSGPSKEYSY